MAMQKAVNCTLKGHLLQAERRHIGKPLTANGLQTRYKACRKPFGARQETGTAGITANRAPAYKESM